MRLNKNFTLVIISVVLIAVGFGFLTPSINEKDPLDTAPISYSQMTSSNISPGQRIQGDIVGNYGAYMEEFTKISGIRAGTDYQFYLIDLGNNGYIGVKVPYGPLSQKFDEQSNDTYAYLSGQVLTMPAPISYNGVVQKASAFHQRYMKEYLVEMGYSDREAELYTSKYIIEQESSSSPILKAIGPIMIFIGFAILIFFIISMIIQKKNRIVAGQPTEKKAYTPYNPSSYPSDPFGDSMNGVQYSGSVSGLSSYDDMNDYEDEYEEDDDDDQPKRKFSLKLDD
ncbi:MAG: hypothetical protein IJ079_05540 [Lachnospiraceae bacterium]|nr:hypothetical protein [Lachnospiraceae bacterium]MBR1567331.1 hypothetical protein [Lachnospiraceae bacterium]